MKADVRGYLLKDTPVSELAAALRSIHAGGKAISPELALTLWNSAANPLTERENAYQLPAPRPAEEGEALS